MWMPRTWADVEAAIDVLEEGPQLDFKSAFDADTAKDVAAMSVDGGVIVYGIDERKTTTAQAVTPVPLRGARERIQQIADSAVHPPAEVEISLIRENDSDEAGVVLVVVPASPLAPHMANDRFPARAGTTTRYLTEPEV